MIFFTKLVAKHSSVPKSDLITQHNQHSIHAATFWNRHLVRSISDVLKCCLGMQLNRFWYRATVFFFHTLLKYSTYISVLLSSESCSAYKEALVSALFLSTAL